MDTTRILVVADRSGATPARLDEAGRPAEAGTSAVLVLIPGAPQRARPVHA
jgi:hypothetical protein